jgi:Phage Tail Collar Domain
MANTTPITNTSGDHVYTVPDGATNTDTSLTFIGRNYTGYTQVIGEDFLHLLENFASAANNASSDISSGPRNPVRGQIWYNSLNDPLTKGLRVFDGTSWIQLGIVKKSPSAPSGPVTGFNIGDVYIDTTRKQLYIYTGVGSFPWQLIGPKYNEGEKTTAEVDLIIDAADNSTRPVLGLYVKNSRVAIVSDREFTPKAVQQGFPVIKQGLNLNTNIPQANSSGLKFWGISEKAESLIVGDTTVAANNFLRSDQVSITKYGFNIRNDSGMLVGTDLSLSIGVDNGASVITNKNVGSRINFKIQKALASATILTIDAGDVSTTTGKVGINNTAPAQSLDVIGNIKTNSSLIITGDNNSDVTAPNIPSITTAGGMTIAKSLSIGKSLYVEENSTMSNILPKTVSNTLGNSSNKWSSVWTSTLNALTVNATTITGDTFNGTSEFANKLTNGIGIKFSGDIKLTNTENILYLNTLDPSLMTISLTPDVIANKPEITSLVSSDLLLVSRELSGSRQLNRISKNNLVSTLPFVAIGTITIWAGSPLAALPLGYRICDGSSLPTSVYPDLFNVIGYSYTRIDPANHIDESIQDNISVFKLPNLSNDSPLDNLKFIIYTGRIA